MPLLRPLAARAAVAVVAMVLVLPVACSEPEHRPIDLNDPGPLEGLSPCPEPAPAKLARVRGFLAPPETLLYAKKPSGERLTEVTGFVELTPIAIRQFYEGLKRIKVIQIEDEVYEAEAFFSAGKYRVYLKATASCSTGSDIFAIVAPEDYEEAVPRPTGTAPSKN